METITRWNKGLRWRPFLCPPQLAHTLAANSGKSPKPRSRFSSTEMCKETADDPMKSTSHHRARPREQRRHGSRIQRRQGTGPHPEPRSGWQRSHSRRIWDNFCDPQLFCQAQSTGTSRNSFQFRGLRVERFEALGFKGALGVFVFCCLI